MQVLAHSTVIFTVSRIFALIACNINSIYRLHTCCYQLGKCGNQKKFTVAVCVLFSIPENVVYCFVFGATKGQLFSSWGGNHLKGKDLHCVLALGLWCVRWLCAACLPCLDFPGISPVCMLLNMCVDSGFLAACSCVMWRAQRTSEWRCARRWLLRRHKGDLLLQ